MAWTEACMNNDWTLGYTDVFYHYFQSQKKASVYVHMALLESVSKVTEADIKTAVSLMADHQEALQVRIVRDVDKPGLFAYKYQKMDYKNAIDIEFTDIDQADQWPALENKYENLTFGDETDLLWKVVIASVRNSSVSSVNQYVLLFFIHHAVSDGKSMFDFIANQFLPVLNAIVDKTDPLPLCRHVPLSPTLEDVFLTREERSRPPSRILSFILNIIRCKNRIFGKGGSDPVYICFDEDPKLLTEVENSQISFPFTLPQDLTQNVLRKAKAHGVTVHTVLLVADMLALCHTLQKVPKVVEQSWAIELRKHCDGLTSPHPLKVLGTSSSTKIQGRKHLSQEEFWSLCNSVYADVVKGKTIANAKKPMYFGKYLFTAAEKECVDKILDELKSVTAAAVSNLGNCDAEVLIRSESTQNVSLREHHFMITGMRTLGVIAFFHGLSTYRGRMFWNLCRDPHHVSEKFARTYIQNIKTALYSFFSEDGTPV